ncbi:MAG: HypC/HybG/HupF family hydrogenase formation chaperone [Bacteroidota bacterium]
MCLGIPVQIKSIDNEMAIVTVEGVEYKAGLQLLPGCNVGDFVMLHAGFAIEKIDPEEAAETLRLLNEVADNSHH